MVVANNQFKVIITLKQDRIDGLPEIPFRVVTVHDD
jgi:hypothetical protein